MRCRTGPEGEDGGYGRQEWAERQRRIADNNMCTPLGRMMDAEAAPPGFSGRKLEERAYILLPHPADEADDALEERFVAPGNLIAAKAALYLAMRQFAKLGRSLVLSLEHAA